jgi:hypothetical protein
MAGEQRLPGGLDPASAVSRVGDTVRRAASPSSAATRALLDHLQDVGFTGAPRFLGTDQLGRDVLTYVAGEVPLPPYPEWALTDAALVSLGELLREFHDATRGLDGRAVEGWSGEWADPAGGPVVCHNDVFPENTVFRDGRVVALIDFGAAAPGRPLWDLAITATEWCPLHAPGARLDHPDELDGVRRLGVLTRAYGLDPAAAARLIDVVAEERTHSTAHIRAEAAAGRQPWATLWKDTGGESRAAADSAWLIEHRADLLAAIGE